jgi:hypothetical protein
MYSARYAGQVLMTLEFSRQIFEKCSNINCHENPSSGSRIVPRGRTDGQTDVTKLILAFRNFANAPKTYGCTRTGLEGRGRNTVQTLNLDGLALKASPT